MHDVDGGAYGPLSLQPSIMRDCFFIPLTCSINAPFQNNPWTYSPPDSCTIERKHSIADDQVRYRQRMECMTYLVMHDVAYSILYVVAYLWEPIQYYRGCFWLKDTLSPPCRIITTIANSCIIPPKNLERWNGFISGALFAR